ncbi:MAG: hypothetical protein M1838_003384 [Thelocarpon superellum]|nr:MAG: hypothetical protein M1838_003384 [Thelocarpon superellum]
MQPALAPAPHPMPPQDNAAEQSLREHLLAASVTPQTPASRNLDSLQATPTSPNDQNIDPAIAGAVMEGSPSNESGGEDGLDASGKKGNKRELSTSKRAAQNRAAQRAFRQRKETYIKKLEEKVKDLHALEENYKAIQAENYQLRDYIINLQSRLIESQGEFPQPPSNIDLTHPPQEAPPHPGAAPTAQMTPSVAANHLQASAAQAQVVAELGAASKHHHEEAAFLAGKGYPSKRLRESEPDSTRTDPALSKLEANGQV